LNLGLVQINTLVGKTLTTRTIKELKNCVKI
jgi:hypothetical protein